jgi:hypothetical protein
MAAGTFYLHKAVECDRMAAAAADPLIRSRYQEEAALWREIAGDIARKARDEGGLP